MRHCAGLNEKSYDNFEQEEETFSIDYTVAVVNAYKINFGFLCANFKSLL